MGQRSASGGGFLTADCGSERLAKLCEQGASRLAEESTAAGALESPPQPTVIEAAAMRAIAARTERAGLGKLKRRLTGRKRDRPADSLRGPGTVTDGNCS